MEQIPPYQSVTIDDAQGAWGAAGEEGHHGHCSIGAYTGGVAFRKIGTAAMGSADAHDVPQWEFRRLFSKLPGR
jgi:hypothetical protein